MLPSKPRGVPRVNDRRLNGIFWVLRSGAPWRDLPKAFGPYTTCYNRFVRWRRAGVWSRIIDALAAAHQTGPQASRTRHRWRGGLSAVGVGEIPDDLARLKSGSSSQEADMAPEPGLALSLGMILAMAMIVLAITTRIMRALPPRRSRRAK